jgi:hypothetical protein
MSFDLSAPDGDDGTGCGDWSDISYFRFDINAAEKTARYDEIRIYPSATTIIDSTSNRNIGTKKSTSEPVEAAGQVGQGQHFDADYITHATFLDVMPDDLTIEMCVRVDAFNTWQYFFHKENITSEDRIGIRINLSDKVDFVGEADDGGWTTTTSSGALSVETWYYIAGVHTHDAAMKIYIDTTETSGATLGNILDGTDFDFFIGQGKDPTYPFDGKIDEVRFSGTPRTAAWLKATKHSLWDNLLTYGAEEVGEVEGVNVMFLFSNF